MLCLVFFIGMLSFTNAVIQPYISQKNIKIECVIRYLIQNFSHRIVYNPTILVFENVTDDNFYFDIIVKEATSNRVPYLITDDINGIIFTTKVGTLFSLTYIEDCKALHKIMKKMDKNIKYFIIINEICEAILPDILHEYQLYDVRFIILDEDTRQFVFLTISSVMNEENCRLTKHITKKKIETDEVCSHQRDRSKTFFSRAIFNMNKCKFNVGMATLYPYSMTSQTDLENMTPLNDVHGADVELIKIIASYFNATLRLYYIYREEETPFLHTEFVDLVLNGSLDACAGGLYRIYGNVVTYSGIYSQQSVVWVYTIERTESIETLIDKIRGLYIFFIFYILHSITWIILCKFEQRDVSLEDTLLRSWGALVASTSLQVAKTVKQRFVNILYLFMCLLLTSYINCQMYSYLTILDAPEHFKTKLDLISSGTKPYLVKHFRKDQKYDSFRNTTYNCNNFKECETLMLKNKGSTVLIDGHLPLLQASTAVNGEARVLRVANEVIIIYHEMLIGKDSPIAKYFAKITMSMFEAGICKKLYENAIGLRVIEKAKHAVKTILSNSYRCSFGCSISLAQLSYVFVIWIAGCIVSCAAFAIEIFLKKGQCRQIVEVT